MIKLRNVKKKVSDKIILDIDKLDIENNTLNILEGKNGSGKTTLMNILACFDYKFEGEVEILGIKLNKKSDLELRQRITMMFTAPILLDRNVKDNILLRNQTSEGEIESMLDALKLKKNILNNHVAHLSTGEKRKVVLISRLLLKRDILLLDEPFSNADKNSAILMFDLIREEQKKTGNTTIIATHIDIFNEYANNILRLERGKLL